MISADYVTITTILRHVRDESIYIDVSRDSRRQVCVPRSLLFGGDDLMIPNVAIGCEIKLRIRRWKAEQLGRRPDRKRAQEKGLFG